MSQSGTILVCACRQAQMLPRPALDATLRHLLQAGTEFVVVGDLCALAAGQASQLRTFAQTGPLRVAACFPRAVKGLLASAGLSLSSIQCQTVNLRQLPSANELANLCAPQPVMPAAQVEQQLAEIHTQLIGAQLLAVESGAISPRQTPASDGWLPWYPVIDFTRCTHCLQCLSFCLFGVFGANEQGQIQVQSPTACKANCPACSRVCPEAAIMFPKHPSGPISGDEFDAESASREVLKVDVSALLGGDLYAQLRTRSQRASGRFSANRDAAQAQQERQRWLSKFAGMGDIPPEVLAALPAPEEIAQRALQAKSKAQAAREDQRKNSPAAEKRDPQC